jgi:hypothetical protein
MHHYFLSVGKGIHLRNKHAIHHRKPNSHLIASLSSTHYGKRHVGGSLARDNEIDRLTNSAERMQISHSQKRNLRPIHFKL